MNPICVTCGAQFPGANPPTVCRICEDERQFVGWEGQAWTCLSELQRTHALVWREEGDAIGIDMKPQFGIGQRAIFIETRGGNVLWDCLSLVTDEVVASIKACGGLVAIAISHPHYYTALADWSEALGGVPVFLHADDAEHVTRPHASIRHWSGETLALADGLTLIRCGGHFSGATVLHWRDGADGRGALCVGDVTQVVMDRRHVSFMYSYPNFMPLGAAAVERIGAALAPYSFDRIYGAFRHRNIMTDARAALDRSIARYAAAVRDGR